jgi:hypothetical protein
VVAQISTLQSTADNVETIRALIATVIKEESANQVVLADAAVVPSEPYDLRVYTERWLQFDHAAQMFEQGDRRTIVNIWISTEQADKGKSNPQSCQRYQATFNIDIYGYGIASSDGASGQVFSDTDANARRDQGRKLVRRFLHAADNIYLRNRGLVFGGFVTNSEYFLPTVEDHPTPSVRAVRLTYEVDYREFSPGLEPQDLEIVAVDVCTRDPDTGEYILAAELDFDYTSP